MVHTFQYYIYHIIYTVVFYQKKKSTTVVLWYIDCIRYIYLGSAKIHSVPWYNCNEYHCILSIM